MFLPDPDSWPYTNIPESIYRGNPTDMTRDGTLSGIAAAYRTREERRVVEGWAAQANEQEQEKSETKETRRKLPERALKILHLFFQNISPFPSPTQQTDLLTYIHTTIPGAEWFGPNQLRAWFISRRSEGTAMRLVDEVVAVRGMRYREEVQVQLRAQGMQQRQLVYRERSDEKDVVTCESILYPTLTTPKISKLAILHRNNPTPNKNDIEVWARALRAEVEDVRNWVQIRGGGGGGGGNIPPPVVNSHPHNFPMTTNSPARVVPQHTPIPWWPSTTPSSTVPHPTSSSLPSSSAASRTSTASPGPKSTPTSTPPAPQPQHLHEAETSHIPYRRHPAVSHHDFRTQYRGAAAPRWASNPYGRVYRPPVEVCPTATTTTTTMATSGRPRRPLPFSLSSVRPSVLPSHHPILEAHLRGRGRGQLRAIRPRPTSSTASTPLSSTATSTVPNCDDGEELFDPATLRDLISVPAQYRQPWSHTLPHISPPSHPRRPPRPYPHLLRHLAHSHSHTHPRPHRRADLDHNTNDASPRQASSEPVVDHEYASAARSSLSAVVPPSFHLDLGPSVYSPSSLSVRSSPVIDLTGSDDDVDGDMGVPVDSESEESAKALPPASTHTVFAEPSSTYSDVEDDDGEPMDLESDDDDAPSIFESRHHLAKEPKVRRNLLAELAKFVHERLAYSQANGSVGLAKGEQFDFDAALVVCEIFYERIKSGVYAGIGRGLVLREVDVC